MQISKQDYDEWFAGYMISDCAVRSNDILCFITRHIDESENAGPTAEGKVTKRLISYLPDDAPGQRFGYATFEGFRNITVGASKHTEDKCIVVSVDGLVYSTGGGTAGDEDAIPMSKDGPRRGAIFRTRTIEGILYAVGSGHTVCYRQGRNQWTSLCQNLPIETRANFDDPERSDNMSFVDIAGFNARDLYVIAGKGRMWHFDGAMWHAVRFSSNMYLHSICCAGDGYVYVGAQAGNVFRGRNNEWKLIVRGMLTLPFKDIVWHAGRIWLTNDHGLWILDREQLVPAVLPSSEIAVCAGNLSVGDGVMLMAGTHGAAIHDGTSWKLIFNTLQWN